MRRSKLIGGVRLVGMGGWRGAAAGAVGVALEFEQAGAGRNSSGFVGFRRVSPEIRFVLAFVGSLVQSHCAVGLITILSYLRNIET